MDKIMEDEKQVQNFDQDELISVFDFQKMGKSKKIIKVEATDKECQKLENRFKIENISDLKATCTINHMEDTPRVFYSMDLNIRAEVTQLCVVTLEPVVENINHDCQILFVHKKYFEDNLEGGEIDFSEDDTDTEILDRTKGNSKVNLGEYIAQHLATALNPYPRKSDATGKELGVEILHEEKDKVGMDKKNPFDILKNLKK